MNKAQRDAIRARVEAATPGPLRWGVSAPFSKALLTPKDTVVMADDCVDTSIEDLEFYAHAREDVPALLDEVERLRGLLKEFMFNCVCTFNEYGDCHHCGGQGTHDANGHMVQQHNEGCTYLLAQQAVEDMEATNDG